MVRWPRCIFGAGRCCTGGRLRPRWPPRQVIQVEVARQYRYVRGRSGITVLEDMCELGLFVLGAEDVEVHRIREQRMAVGLTLDDHSVALLGAAFGAGQLQMAGPLDLNAARIPDQRVGLDVAPHRLRGDLVALVATTQQ